MTKALCVLCGAMKFGVLLPCKACGMVPRTRREVGYSYALSDHFFDLDELKEMSREMIEEDKPHPVLPLEQEAEFIERFGKGFPETVGEPGTA